MNVVIFATEDPTCSRQRIGSLPAPMLPVLDRPAVQHIVEHFADQYFADQRVPEMDIVLSRKTEMLADVLSDGMRWGVTLRYHWTEDEARPYDVLRSRHFNRDGAQILLGHADRLPAVHVQDLLQCSVEGSPMPICAQSPSNPREWTGWALIPSDLFEAMPQGQSQEELEDFLFLMARIGPPVIQVPVIFDVRSLDGLLSAHAAMITGRQSQLLAAGKETRDGIWFGRNVRVHDSARLTSPLFLGSNTRIEKNVRLGPQVFVGPNCIIDCHTRMEQALVFPNTYVGQRLDVSDCIVDSAHLVNLNLNAALTFDDPLVVSGI